jgi:tRNA 2-thiouridine synthesizing protein A
MVTVPKPDHTLDAKGLLCPQPVLKTKIEMDKLKRGQVLQVLATDLAAEPDIKAWARRTGNTYIGAETEGEVWKIYVKKE